MDSWDLQDERRELVSASGFQTWGSDHVERDGDGFSSSRQLDGCLCAQQRLWQQGPGCTRGLRKARGKSEGEDAGQGKVGWGGKQ